MKFKDCIDSICKFYKSQGYDYGKRPDIKIIKKKNNRFDPFIETGKFSYADNTIYLDVNNRHLKDVLRTFCHELFHKVQYEEDHKQFESISLAGSLDDNEELQEIEAQAYLNGNVLFRKWTEQFRQK